jgi:hypothetical protein
MSRKGLNKDLHKVRDYISGHSDRLQLDIDKAMAEYDHHHENYYKGAKDTCKVFLRLIDDIIERDRKHLHGEIEV